MEKFSTEAKRLWKKWWKSEEGVEVVGNISCGE